MNSAFDAASLERGYAFLDDCPENLLQEVVTLPLGSLPERVAGVRRWHDALLAGTLPSADAWPSSAVAAPARRALEEMGLVRFCKGQPELVDAVLKDVVMAFARCADRLRSEVVMRLRELEELERVRRGEQEEARARREKRAIRPVVLDEDTLRRLREQAKRETANRPRDADPDLVAAWGERAHAWSEIDKVFGDLGRMLGRGWDLSSGLLRHTGWLDLLRLRDLVAQLPQLRDIVRALGRLQVSDSGTSVAESILIPVHRLEAERLETRTPHVPAETRGVERSGEIGRMLPVEASMLGHPKLRLLWHARRAEGALLTYRVEGMQAEQGWVEREVAVETDAQRPTPERGPIVVVVDTSGSMHGLPEQVAKALVLEALRTAHAEKRHCFLYAYSGLGQVVEHELDLSPDGVGRLLAFLGLSFSGGSDETGVMERVVTRLKEQEWKKADVLFVSDGEWPAPENLVFLVQRARDDGTRFHGVQIGNRGRTGLHSVCDPVHVFQDWAAAGGASPF